MRRLSGAALAGLLAAAATARGSVADAGDALMGAVSSATSLGAVLGFAVARGALGRAGAAARGWARADQGISRMLIDAGRRLSRACGARNISHSGSKAISGASKAPQNRVVAEVDRYKFTIRGG